MINVHNKDGKYFEFSILAALYHNQIPRTHTSRSYHCKNHLGTRLKWSKEPMKIEDIPNFEKQNHIPICVYRIKWNGEEVFLLYITKNRDQDPINLLLIEGDEHYHFTWIKNLNKLLSDPIYPDTKCFVHIVATDSVKKGMVKEVLLNIRFIVDLMVLNEQSSLR